MQRSRRYLDFSIKDFLISDITCSLKSHEYKVCDSCYAPLKSARLFPIEAIVKRLSMVKQSTWVVDGVVGLGTQAIRFRVRFAYAKRRNRHAFAWVDPEAQLNYNLSTLAVRLDTAYDAPAAVRV